MDTSILKPLTAWVINGLVVNRNETAKYINPKISTVSDNGGSFYFSFFTFIFLFLY